MSFNLVVERAIYRKQAAPDIKVVGKWRAGLNTVMQVETGALQSMASRPRYRVVTSEVSIEPLIPTYVRKLSNVPNMVSYVELIMRREIVPTLEIWQVNRLN